MIAVWHLWACQPSPPAIGIGSVAVKTQTEVVRPVLRSCVPGQKSQEIVPPDERIDLARAVLDGMVRDFARDPENPWAVAHALLALGTDFQLTNGREPVGWLYERWGTLDAAGLPDFPTSAGEARVEPHTDLLLKSVAESGMASSTAITVQGRALTLQDAWFGAASRIWVAGETTSATSWNDTPWTLAALAAWAPEDFEWTAAGHPMSMDAFASAEVSRLRTETAFLREARGAGEEFRKRGQGIFAYTCGGAHLYQGAAFAVARGFGTPSDRVEIDEQTALLFWRFPIELRELDAVLKARPEMAPVLVAQRMKFIGHFLESVHRASAWGLHKPSGFERATLAGALVELVKTVELLVTMRVPASLPQIRATNEQLFLDYVGDAAHALKGLDLATGRAGVCG